MLTEKGTAVTGVLNIAVPDQVLNDRCVGRRLCSNKECGAIYHVISNPPAQDNVCDRCRSELLHRSDDRAEAVEEAAELHRQTEPRGLYSSRGLLHEVDGVGCPMRCSGGL